MTPARLKPDLIAAIATPPGRGGVGVIRVSGPGAEALGRAITGRVLKPRHATYLGFLDAQGGMLDEGLALYFPGPHSFTGEDVMELQGHGGPAVMQTLLSRCLELGARLARAGEFTQRAFLNGKLDLAQAEAVADLIDASSREAARSALLSLTGVFSGKVNTLVQSLINLRMRVEASLDFPEEEDVVEIERQKIDAGLARILKELDEVLISAGQGALLRDGVSVVLIGQPNVGKSSLLNALAGEEIALVTDIAGTTRDTIRQEIHIEGISFHLIDTAGLRETNDPVERAGIARTWQAIEKASIALLMTDVRHGLGNPELAILASLPADIVRLHVHNKIDLVNEAPGAVETDRQVNLRVSAKTGAGVELLRQELLRLAGWQPAGEGAYMARSRHMEALKRAHTALENAVLLGGRMELQAEELRDAQDALSSITGEFNADDLLGEIFSRFCVGK